MSACYVYLPFGFLRQLLKDELEPICSAICAEIYVLFARVYVRISTLHVVDQFNMLVCRHSPSR